MAQYRELESVPTSFASDLDARPQKRQLERGARTVEVLKQGQYQPMAVEQQVMTIYAVSNGFLDEVEVPQIRAWEQGFHEFMSARYPKIGETIRTKKALPEDLENELKAAIAAYKQTVPAGSAKFTAASL